MKSHSPFTDPIAKISRICLQLMKINYDDVYNSFFFSF